MHISQAMHDLHCSAMQAVFIHVTLDVFIACREKLPLLVLHGGPGLPSRYLETLELLAGQGRQVIFYDQVV